MARSRFNGAAATLAALVGGGIGLSLALFLRALILNTPAQVRPSTFFWWFVLLTAAGALWGLATQSMKQLELIQGYRQGGSLRGRGRSGAQQSAAQRREHEQRRDQNRDQEPGEGT
ncbi:MAG: hypothetical protein R6U00_00135 [Prochlorococcaceae cyanobacterium]